MNLIDVLLNDHRALRGALEALHSTLGEAAGTGWDDRVAIDGERFLRRMREFVALFKAHEALEDEFLSRVVRQLGLNPDLEAAVAEGHRSLEEITRLFGVVVSVFDGEHAYAVRAVLARLSEELEGHLSFEEGRVFPKLRERLPVGLLRELGRRAGNSVAACR